MAHVEHASDDRVVMIETGVLIHNHNVKTGDVLASQKSAIPAVISDVTTIGKLLKDFGFSGKFVLNVHKGRQYIIFKGYAGTRTLFRGTRYLYRNPRVLEMAIGKIGLARSVAKSSYLTVFTYCFIDAPQVLFEYRDRTLGELGVRFASDLTKIAVTSLASLAAGMAVATSGIFVAPLAAALVAGIAVGMGLEYIDQKLKITQKIEEYVRDRQKEFEDQANRHYRDFEQEFLRWICSQGGPCVGNIY